jgi:tetratricopeptide (TPR) repeat protein
MNPMLTGGRTAFPTVYLQARQRAADLMNAGERDAAIPMLRDLLKQQPRDTFVLRMLGNALSQNTVHAAKGTEPENIRLLRFAHQLNPTDPDTLCDLASAARTYGQTRQSHQAADKALELDPSHGRAVMIKCKLLEAGNRVDEAFEVVERARRVGDSPELRIVHATLCLHRKDYQEGIDALTPMIDQVEIIKPRREEMFYLLGQLHDRLGDYDTAFKHFSAANTMQGKRPAANFDAHIDLWNEEVFRAMPKAAADGSRSIMVIGMPRSGTTLTEMILAAHPKIGGIGESPLVNQLAHRNPPGNIDQRIIDAYAKEYLGMLNETVADKSSVRVVDKMPENYIHLGLISHMLPGCKVIHCKRDARDVCLSIYFQAFGPWVQYARDLETIALQYLGYVRMMERWREILDITIHDSVYEDLTADPEPNIRALIDHVAMPFDPACLEPHKTKKSVHTASIAQVRNPIYKSSRQRWKNYEKHIGPMLDLLKDV